MKYKLDRSAHSVYSHHYHLVVVVKYRRKDLYDEVIRERLKQIIWNLAEEVGIEILAQEPAEDHLHLLFKATPKANIVSGVNVIKGVTARGPKQEFTKTKEFLWGDSF
ncbi:IS200/IS605 family transposase [Methanotrichaceae archaeon Mx]|uniref:IS200/IS605 family transposase n=1 Tax=Candidatus Methanocrinis natronophilus TaxID=3033396 RepID=A0ABT5X8Z3_9EURY|nr:IS200/IS605 family transposase [Candidatus Methanocrinis natronophilus]MDF0591170.1 IS200/IS605 family transposase [Candidatus Methanocrinis natronophilus]